ncbi:MAG TPA: hypothetical protein ENK75_05570, partial [Saprospiraceae bacterium]|nr:hypothetical protein [Saprospiraceae bacterium]
MRSKSFLILILLLFGFMSIAKAQSNNDLYIKKLEQQLSGASAYDQGVIYNRMSDYYSYKNPALAIEKAKKSMSIFLDLDDKQGLAQSYTYLATAFFFNAQQDSCLFYTHKIIEMSNDADLNQYLDDAYYINSLAYRKIGQNEPAMKNALRALTMRLQQQDSLHISEVYGSISKIYKRQGNYSRALDYQLKSIVLNEKYKDSIALLRDYYGIADLYMYLKKYDLAKKNYLLAKKFIKNKGSLGDADITNSLGAIYFEKEQLDSALHYYKIALQYYKANQSKEGVPSAYENLGEVYAKMGNFNKGIRLLKKAETEYNKLGYSQDLTSVYNILGQSYMNIHNKDSADYYFKKSFEAADIIDYADRKMLSLQNLYELHLRAKDTIKAYRYFKQLIHFKDSIQLHKNQLQVSELEKKYQTTKKQKEIERLANKEKLQKAKFRTLLIGSGLVILFLPLMGFFILQKRKKERIITELELEKTRLLNQQLEGELELKNRQLTTHSLNMMQKNTIVQEFNEHLQEITKYTDGLAKTKLKSMKNEISKMINSEKDWDTFKIYFEQVNKDFIANLKQLNTALTG